MKNLKNVSLGNNIGILQFIKIAPLGFEPRFKAPKASRLDRYLTGLDITNFRTIFAL